MAEKQSQEVVPAIADDSYRSTKVHTRLTTVESEQLHCFQARSGRARLSEVESSETEAGVLVPPRIV